MKKQVAENEEVWPETYGFVTRCWSVLCEGVLITNQLDLFPWTATSVADQCPAPITILAETPLKAQLHRLTGTFSHQAAFIVSSNSLCHVTPIVCREISYAASTMKLKEGKTASEPVCIARKVFVVNNAISERALNSKSHIEGN